MQAGGLGWADPTDLDGLREALRLADLGGRLAAAPAEREQPFGFATVAAA